ncbi:MAG: winged helix-turn-helix transcriptional regulator [Oscillospiraceae bacterium]|nr:winged helix-turn-helix transcriptional regulator [Oscillospiraceae bacterium]
MRFFTSLDESLPFFKAMSSDIRIQILNILTNEPGMNLNDLSNRLGITSGALTSHIRLLEDAGVIEVKAVPAKHGIQKICMVIKEKHLFQVGYADYEQTSYRSELSPGHYIDYDVTPTCGIATLHRVVGVYDNPVYFADAERFNAQVLWFTTGFVEYEIPNYLPENSICKELVIQAELGSEAAGFNNDYKSDIHFSINGKHIGVWQSPGDFGGIKGIYNPDWWIPSMNQHGELMEIRINDQGCFMEKQQVSDVTPNSLKVVPKDRIRLRLEIPKGLPNSRGLTIFGRGFGNYNIGIMVNVSYDMIVGEVI